MITTIIKLKNELSEQHYHDKNKPVFINVHGELYQIDRVDEFDDCVHIVTNGDVKIMEDECPV